MGNDRAWYGLQLGLVVFWLIIPLIGIMGYELPFLTTIALVIFAAHVLEVPLAINLIRKAGLEVPSSKIVLNTLVFGFTWWLPVSKQLIKP